jgi:pimeloyl-ACP methyl ester carboxylesterase
VAVATVLAGLALGALLAACGSSAAPTWTMAVAQAPARTPAASPSTAPTASPLPSASTTPAPASPSVAPSASAPPSAGPSASPAAPGWSFVKREPCPESRFECVTLAVPSDHFTPGSPPWDVTFAIQRAAGRRVGTYVVITGGPGTSGISAADGYADYYPASITEHMDVVFLDQRGIGLSHPFQCPEATRVYYSSTVRPQDPAQAEAAGRVAHDYVDQCLAEAGVPEADLPLYSTRQAIEDLEAIRQYLGVDEMDLYGESYGTQYVQTYATKYPDHVKRLYLDGPVDLTLDGATYYAEAARSFDDVLVATLHACEAEPACAADFGGTTPLAAYDALAGRLATPVTIDFPLGDGTTTPRTLTLADLENSAVSYLYTPGDRMILLRALAAAARDDLVPLARLGYASIGVHPDTLAVEPDPSWSDALYYAVECQDYVYNADSTDDADRLSDYLADARTLGVPQTRLGALYYGDMPCLYWPNRPAEDPRPSPIVDAPYPTIVLVATTDPITPVSMAIRLANRLSDANVIIQTGGPHVIFGWGLGCPDNVVARYMVDGVRPANRITVCNGDTTDPYVALAKPDRDDYPSDLAFMRSIANQVQNTNDYWYRFDDEPIDVGCDFGGVLTYRPAKGGTGIDLDACELVDGEPMTGTGRLADSGAVTLDLTLPDGPLEYRMRPSGKDELGG